jgi:hypothetical protein
MTASANRSEAGETTTRPETRFHKKNQVEPVLAQSRVFQQARSFSGTYRRMSSDRQMVGQRRPKTHLGVQNPEAP